MSVPTAAQVRALNAVIETCHSILYFAAPVQARWAALGMEPRGEGYVAGRAAPLGRVGASTAAAVFFNFNPVLFHHALPGAWEKADPATVLAERAAGIEETLTSVDAPADALAGITELAGQATAGVSFAGRPLAAGNAAVPLPAQPFARAWQAISVLREHRGDGHVAVLTASGLSPVAVLALYAAWQDTVSQRFLQRSRLWDEDAWAAGEDELRARGWMDDDGALTADGTTARERIEHDTDVLATPPYAALGADGTERLFALLQPLATAVADGGVYPRPPTVPETYPAA